MSTDHERRVLVSPDKQSLAVAVADRFLKKLPQVIEKHGIAHICLTGGTMGGAVLEAVNASAHRDSVDWSKVVFWWGDERFLPRGDPDRNDTQSIDALLAHLPLQPEQVKSFPAPGDYADIEAAADAYAAELAAAAAPGERAPHFAITFLGVGPDGHIASLFPEHPQVLETARTVVADTDSPKPPPERLSLTLPVINGSDRIWLVLSGSDKAGALGLALADASVSDVPASGAQGRYRTVFWVDRDASAEVPTNLIAPSYYWTSAQDVQEQ